MTPQVSPKDAPQNPSDSEPEDAEENGVVFVESSSEEDETENDEIDFEDSDTQNHGYLLLDQDVTDQSLDESHQVLAM